VRNADLLLARNRCIVEEGKAEVEDFFRQHRDDFRWARPQAGTFAFPRFCSERLSSREYCDGLVEHAGILLCTHTVLILYPHTVLILYPHTAPRVSYTPYTIHSYTIHSHTIHCTHTLHSYTIHYTRTLYTILTIHYNHYSYTIITIHSLYTVLTIHCTGLTAGILLMPSSLFEWGDSMTPHEAKDLGFDRRFRVTYGRRSTGSVVRLWHGRCF
jgi:hypothetical protein